MAFDVQGLPASLEIRTMIGEGSFGIVYEVWDARTKARRALKCVRVAGDGRRESREAEIFRQLDHPHVLRCFETGASPGQVWILTELAERTLLDEIRGPAKETLLSLSEAARGVAALHAKGLVHRDLKPENILLVGGVAKVADLGLVRGNSLETLTATGLVLGTPQYMAPEQACGERAGAAADIFALGAIAYEVLERAPLYPTDLKMGALLAQVATGRPARFSTARRRWQPALLDLVLQALDPDPVRRPSDLSSWADALDQQLRAPPRPSAEKAAPTQIVASRVAPSRPRSRPSQRPTPPAPSRTASRWRLLTISSIGVLAALTVAGLVLRGTKKVDREPPAPTSSDPFPPHWIETVTHEFEAAQSKRIYEGVLHLEKDLKQDEFERSRPLLDPLPGRWGEVLEELPETSRFYEWMAQGGEFDQLPVALAESLRDLDRRYRNFGAYRPFSPYVDLTVSGEPRSFTAVTAPRREVQLVAGWGSRALIEFEALEATCQDLERQATHFYQHREPATFPGARLDSIDAQFMLAEVETVGKAGRGNFLDHLPSALIPYPVGLRTFQSWLEPAFDAFERVLVATDRAGRAGEPGFDELVLLLVERGRMRRFAISRWLTLRRDWFPGAQVSTPAGQFLRNWLEFEAVRWSLMERAPRKGEAYRSPLERLRASRNALTGDDITTRRLAGWMSYYEAKVLTRHKQLLPLKSAASAIQALLDALPALPLDLRLRTAVRLVEVFEVYGHPEAPAQARRLEKIFETAEVESQTTAATTFTPGEIPAVRKLLRSRY